MFAILKKEINIFFSSFIAYIVIGVFLIATGLFLWIIPDTNVLDYGYATLNQMFDIAPWVFLFLIPAITMRSFAEEKKAGTIEIISTKPITDTQIILGKYFGSLILVLFSIIPSLLYFYTVFYFAEPLGNMDIGGTWGQYIGLFFLGASYVAVGIFASAITDNQIISFILSLFLIFVFYSMLEMMRGYTELSSFDKILEYLNIDTHYKSMSRGVIDSRDLIYFVSFIAIFIFLTKAVLERKKSK